MDVLEELGILHNAMQPGTPAGDVRGWRDQFVAIREALEADPTTDRFDRETLAVIAAKFDALLAEIDAGAEEPDFKPVSTWVAAMGAAVYRRREAAKAAADARQGTTH
jgi:hypothetical protein